MGVYSRAYDIARRNRGVYTSAERKSWQPVGSPEYALARLESAIEELASADEALWTREIIAMLSSLGCARCVTSEHTARALDMVTAAEAKRGDGGQEPATVAKARKLHAWLSQP